MCDREAESPSRNLTPQSSSIRFSTARTPLHPPKAMGSLCRIDAPRPTSRLLRLLHHLPDRARLRSLSRRSYSLARTPLLLERSILLRLYHTTRCRLCLERQHGQGLRSESRSLPATTYRQGRGHYRTGSSLHGTLDASGGSAFRLLTGRMHLSRRSHHDPFRGVRFHEARYELSASGAGTSLRLGYPDELCGSGTRSVEQRAVRIDYVSVRGQCGVDDDI